MSKLSMSISIEVEGDDISEETQRVVELQVARLGEQLEAFISEHAKPLCPKLKITFGKPE